MACTELVITNMLNSAAIEDSVPTHSEQQLDRHEEMEGSRVVTFCVTTVAEPINIEAVEVPTCLMILSLGVPPSFKVLNGGAPSTGINCKNKSNNTNNYPTMDESANEVAVAASSAEFQGETFRLRPYQVEMVEESLKANIIVVMGTLKLHL